MTLSEDSSRSSQDVQIARLWKSYIVQPDLAGKERLFHLYRDFASRVSLGLFKRYSGFGVCADDFLQNGFVGLYRAIDKFQFDKGASFETFAAYRIKGEILNGLQHYSESFDLYQFRRKLEQERIAAILHGSDTLKSTKSLLNLALDVVTSSIIELAEIDHHDTVSTVHENGDIDHVSFSQQVMRMLGKLPQPGRQVITMHYLYEHSFSEIADILGLSKSAVFKQHNKAIAHFRDLLACPDKELMTV